MDNERRLFEENTLHCAQPTTEFEKCKNILISRGATLRSLQLAVVVSRDDRNDRLMLIRPIAKAMYRPQSFQSPIGLTNEDRRRTGYDFPFIINKLLLIN